MWTSLYPLALSPRVSVADTDSLRPVGVAVKRISISDRDVSDWSPSPLQSDPMSMKFNNTI